MLKRLLLCAPLLLGACHPENKYSVELTPVESGLRRTLTWQPGGGPGAVQVLGEDLAGLASAYGAKAPDGNTGRADFSKVFERDMPADIGGAGCYVTYPTTLGTLHVYIERFRGTDDPVGQWERQRRAIDAGIDLLLLWVDENLAGEQGVDKLRAFMTTQFRRDVQNLIWYLGETFQELRQWADETGDGDSKDRDKAAFQDLAARVGLYFLERGYFTPEELPRTAGGDELMALIRRQMLRRMSRDEADPTFAPPALATSDSWDAAFKAFIQRSPAARKCLDSWAATEPPSERAAALEEQLQHLGAVALGQRFLGRYDKVHAALTCPVEPFATNGKWYAESKRLSWHGSIQTRDQVPFERPLMAYAAWAVPAEAEQSRLLGESRLTGEDLGSYCLWVRGLNSEQSREWNQFLGAFKPGPGQADRMRGFRFTGHEGDKDAPTGPEALARALDLH